MEIQAQETMSNVNLCLKDQYETISGHLDNIFLQSTVSKRSRINSLSHELLFKHDKMFECVFIT